MVTKSRKPRLLACYRYEDGGSIEVLVSGDVPTLEAINMVEAFFSLKKKEIEAQDKNTPLNTNA